MLKTQWISNSIAALLLVACGTTSEDNLIINDQTAVKPIKSLTTNDKTDITIIDAEPTNDKVIPGSVDDFMLHVPDRVFFDFDRYTLSAKAIETLNLQVEWLQKYTNIEIIIGGHTDNRGTREYNLALSEKRARAVRDYMIGLGINADRLNVVPYGKERPALIGDNQESWSANRRVEIKVQVD